jgi:hypothetical protein
MWFVKNPEWFDVIVTDNMFGDIITDLGAMVQGGMGIAAGGNINPQGASMFEPIGGSAPKYTGQGVINPLAAICAGQMMLDFLGEHRAAQAIESAVVKVTREKIKSLAAGKMGYPSRRFPILVVPAVGLAQETVDGVQIRARAGFNHIRAGAFARDQFAAAKINLDRHFAQRVLAL